MKKTSGMFVRTQAGKGEFGRTYNNELPINGKSVVHLVNRDTLEPITDEKGVPKKILCSPDTLQLLGYLD